MTDQVTSAEDVKPGADQVTEVNSGVEAAQSQADAEVQQAQAGAEAQQQTETQPQDGEQPAEGDEGKQKPLTRRDARIEQLLHRDRALRGFAERTLAEKADIQQKAILLPRPEDYPSDAAYLQAVADQSVAKAQLVLVERQMQEANSQAAAVQEEAWQERTSDFRARVPDFDQVAHNPNLKITPVMADAIRESNLGAELAYFLGKNPNEAARIASLAPISQATAIARLETRVSKTSQTQTKAPAPAAQSLKGKSGGGAKSYEDMTFEEYRKARGF